MGRHSIATVFQELYKKCNLHAIEIFGLSQAILSQLQLTSKYDTAVYDEILSTLSFNVLVGSRSTRFVIKIDQYRLVSLLPSFTVNQLSNRSAP